MSAAQRLDTMPDDASFGDGPGVRGHSVGAEPTWPAVGGRTIATFGGTDIAQPLPPLPYLVEKLGIASGAPTCIAGYGFGGKTIACQAMALALVANRPVWGAFFPRAGRVLHLDYEQGQRLTFERYQRLARADGIDLAEVDDRLRVAIAPAVYLDDAGAEDVFARTMDGFDLVIIDSLRAAAPSADENSSEVRKYIDRLGRATAKTGAVCIFIHHARKPKADDPDGAKFKIRGSSALFDACASVFVVRGGERTTHAGAPREVPEPGHLDPGHGPSHRRRRSRRRRPRRPSRSPP